MLDLIWGSLRGSFSQLLDAIAGGSQRLPLPVFISPEAIADYLLEHCIYRADTFDYSIHPERLQWLMETRRWGSQTVDCDDWACYAHAALKRLGHNPMLITLAGNGINEAHMITTYYGRIGGGFRYGAIDVNGHHVINSVSPRDILNHFNSLYESQNIHFTRVFSSPYPFQ